MRTIPVVRAALGGLSGRRVQALVIGLVMLLSTGASTLGLGLLVDSNAPFDHAFAAQHGADVTAAITGASPAQLAATTHLAGVTASAGPFPETGTKKYVAEADAQVSVLGMSDQLSLTGFGGDASWTGYTVISGHWYSGPGQVDVNTAFLNDTGTEVGQQYTLTVGGQHTTVQIAGEVFDPAGGTPEMIGATSTLSAADPGLAPDQYQVAPAPGTDVGSYVNSLSHELGSGYLVEVRPGRVQGGRHDAVAGDRHGDQHGGRDRPGGRRAGPGRLGGQHPHRDRAARRVTEIRTNTGGWPRPGASLRSGNGHGEDQPDAAATYFAGPS